MPRYDPERSAALKETLDNSAAEFANSLNELGSYFEGGYARIVQKTVLDLFGRIIKRSPVDTGAYRASHGLANGSDPGEEEGIVLAAKDEKIGSEVALEKGRAWSWYPGDGQIWLFNNLPYAEPLEFGHSGQAPEGIYRMALTEMNAVLSANIAKAQIRGFE
jgi:hypothetical protein